MAKAIVVGTSAYEIPVSPNRTCLVVANVDTANKIYWGQTEQVTVSSGIPIFPKSIQVFTQQQGDNPHGAKYLIAEQETEARINEEVAPVVGAARWQKKYGSEEEIQKACELRELSEEEEYAL